MLSDNVKKHFIEKLRSERFTQIFNRSIGSEPYHRCVVGVLYTIEFVTSVDLKNVTQLVRWNDNDRLTFAQIADKVEAGELD